MQQSMNAGTFTGPSMGSVPAQHFGLMRERLSEIAFEAVDPEGTLIKLPETM